MVSESRHTAFFLMGLVAVCLVMAFSAYQLTSYDSIRSIIGATDVQPSGTVSLHTQYENLQDFLTSGSGAAFTYHFAGSYMNFTSAQLQGKTEQQCNALVVDTFTKNFYSGTDTGDLAYLYNFVGSGANSIYALLTFIFFVVLVAIPVIAYFRQWFDNNVELLKNAGMILVGLCIVAFLVFLVAPGILNSLFWSSLYKSTLNREVIQVVEPRVSAAFLLNTLIMALVGAVLYGIGYFIGFEEKEYEAKTERNFEQKPARMHEPAAEQMPARMMHEDAVEPKKKPAQLKSAPKQEGQQKPGHRQL